MLGRRVGWTTGAAGVLFLVTALGFGAWSSSHAAEVGDDACMMCHSDRTIVRDRDGSSVHHDPTPLASSVHAGLSCVDCHSDIRDIPHAERLRAPRCQTCHEAQGQVAQASAHGKAGGCATCHGTHDVQRPNGEGFDKCGDCHTDIVAQFRASVHGQGLVSGDTDAPVCRDCHGDTHEVRTSDDSSSPTHHSRLAETCGKCHADREMMTKRKIAIPEAYQLFQSSVHGRSDDPGAATCTDCHESHHLMPAADPTSSINRHNIPATCGKCHEQATRDYNISVHASALERGVKATPVCTGCHGEHLIRGPHDPQSPVAARTVTATCSHCHEATGIRETYGLPAGRLSTYKDSFHGLAARGGSPVVANCASCHRHHDILPSTDPRSAIHPDRLAATCGRCHPGSAAGFAKGSVHGALVSPGHMALVWVRWIYLWLIALTIGGMVMHNGLDFVSKIRRHWARHRGRVVGHVELVGRHYLRMTVFERWQHAFLAGSFLTLVYTGFALKFPEAWPFAWYARLDQGYVLRSWSHRAAAIVMVAVSLVHIWYLFTKRGRSMLPDMMPRWRDFTDFVNNVLYMLGRRSEPPPFERFSYIEKAEYLALIWGTVVMTLTGFALWFEAEALQFLPKWGLDLMTIVHYYEAWLAFLAIVVWHWYQTIVNPDIYPMNWTWLDGQISEEHMRHEHGGELARLQLAELEAERDDANTDEQATDVEDESQRTDAVKGDGEADADDAARRPEESAED